jgi:hypothetical protein
VAKVVASPAWLSVADVAGNGMGYCSVIALVVINISVQSNLLIAIGAEISATIQKL